MTRSRALQFMAGMMLLVDATAALAQDGSRCGRIVCREEPGPCRIVAEPCGSNPDGTVFFCPVEVCSIIRVCEQPPCTTREVDELGDSLSDGDLEDLLERFDFDPPPPLLD